MKRDQISIKWTLFTYLISFVAILLLILWLFQIVFLGRFYQRIKTKAITSAAENIAKNIDNKNLTVLLEEISQQNNMSIRIINDQGLDLCGVELTPNSIIHKMPLNKIFYYFFQIQKEGRPTFEIVIDERLKNKRFDYKQFKGNFHPAENTKTHTMVYAKRAIQNDGTYILILLSSMISPVDATVETLRIQLFYITLLLLFLAILLALFISKKISKPIIEINKVAKELANNNLFPVSVFRGRGYQEITELSNTLNYAAKELSKVENLRRELIANVSHDLRTPLTLIIGYGEIMRDIPYENTSENVQIIIDEAKRLERLVNDMLHISKLQSGTQTLTISTFNLTDMIRDILKRYQKLVEQDHYIIHFIYTEDVYVNADEVKITQVIYNLINNAITYTGIDKKVILYQNEHQGFVKVEIMDTGEGIPPKMLPYIWDRYYKIERKHRRAIVGNGLGLSIVRKILDLHGGDYGVESVQGQGSTFWFILKTVTI
ncbi:MAG: HAMP domain-containing histidine kinase [Epulopiscium sp.]|nr:HAMP domain-containing histidine kinase [Candidatus Epulonipiscium sp.]